MMPIDDYAIFDAAYDNNADAVRVCILDNGVDPNAPHPGGGTLLCKRRAKLMH